MTQHSAQGPFNIPDVTPIAPLDIWGLTKTLWGGKWVILLTTGLAVILAGYYAFAVAGPRYASTTTLHIDTDQFTLADADVRAPVNLNTQIAIITSRQLLDQVIDHLKLEENPAFNRYLTPVSPWSIVGLRTALRNQIAGTDEGLPNAAAIRAKTVENLRGMIAARTQRDSAVLAITVTTDTPETSAQIANTLADIYLADQVNAQFSTTEMAVTWLSEKVFELQVDLAAKETAITDLITRAQISDEATLDAVSRQALETDARLHDARAALSKLDNDTAVVAANVDDDSHRLTNQIAALELFRANLSKQLADQSASMVALQQLRREADATRVLYETFLTRLQDVSLQSGLSTPQNRVLNPAETGRYVAPRKMLILAMAAFVGGAAGIILAFLHDNFRPGLRSANDLAQATGLPVIMQLPVKGLQQAPAQDAARTLRSAVLNKGDDEPAQTILCTASTADEGQRETAFLLAQALMGLGKSVLLFDGNLRRAKDAKNLYAIFGGKIDMHEAIKPDPRWHVNVMTTTCGAHHPTDLFCSQGFNTLLNRLRERFDFIVITAPPVLPTPDTLMIAQHSDAVIYAVRSGKTHAQTIHAGLRALKGVQADVSGLVLTGAELRQQPQTGLTVWPDIARVPMRI